MKWICGRFESAIFYVLCEGIRWRANPCDLPAWQTVYTYFRWRIDGTWLKLHDSLREWTRIEQERYPSPSEAIIDSQSVKSAAMVSQSVGYDPGKQIKGRKRFMTVDTLGLVLRVWVTAARVGEREGGYNYSITTRHILIQNRLSILPTSHSKRMCRVVTGFRRGVNKCSSGSNKWANRYLG